MDESNSASAQALRVPTVTREKRPDGICSRQNLLKTIHSASSTKGIHLRHTGGGLMRPIFVPTSRKFTPCPQHDSELLLLRMAQLDAKPEETVQTASRGGDAFNAYPLPQQEILLCASMAAIETTISARWNAFQEHRPHVCDSAAHRKYAMIRLRPHGRNPLAACCYRARRRPSKSAARR